MPTIDDIDKQIGKISDKIDGLDKRLNTLETTKTVLITVAAIFGVSLGWGAYTLNQINGSLREAKASVTEAEKSVSDLTGEVAQKKQLIEQQMDALRTQAPANTAKLVPGIHTSNGPFPAIGDAQVGKKPFQTAVETFRKNPPPEPYVLEGYKNDLRGLSELLLGYLGYLQSGNHVDRATSDAFFGQVLLAAADVKARSGEKLSRDDPYFEWHTRTSLDNFTSIVAKLKEQQESTPDNTLSPAQITYYEGDIPHWRDGVLGVPLG